MFHNGALNGNTYFLLSLQNQVMLHASEYYLQYIFLDPRIQKMYTSTFWNTATRDLENTNKIEAGPIRLSSLQYLFPKHTLIW